MGYIYKILSVILAIVLFASDLGLAFTREEVRAKYAEMVNFTSETPYAEKPMVTSPYLTGALNNETVFDALSYVNFLRWLAGVSSDVRIDELYALRAMHAAVLVAANDEVAHDAPRAEGMPDDFYETAHAGTMSSNLAAINWMSGDILMTAVEYFVRDDGFENLAKLGHRRWLLNPEMAFTGFGLANSESGMTYAVMYAHDSTDENRAWDHVAWPSEGAFPAELMGADIAWSVVLNEDIYDIYASDIHVEISERTTGGLELSYMNIDNGAYGAGPCVIFVPDLDKIGLSDYQQNQVWTIEISGLISQDGRSVDIEYVVSMIALVPIDPSDVEISPRALSMNTGDVCALTAAVIPEWADDLRVKWESSDETVAIVNEDGIITAIGKGKCEVKAIAANGRYDVCSIAVDLF